MQTVAEARQKVEATRSDSELQGALTELASALYEADAEESVMVADRSIALAEKLGDSLAIAWARHNRGWALNSLGRLEEALADQIAALGEFEGRRDDRGVANTLLAIGDIHGEVGDTSTALEYFDRAAAPMARTGDEVGQGVILNLTGIVLSRELRHREAADLFTQAEKIFEYLADPMRILTTKINRGFELLDMSIQDPANNHVVPEVEKIALEVIDEGLAGGEDGRSTLAYGHSLLSRVHALQGNLEQALAHGERPGKPASARSGHPAPGRPFASGRRQLRSSGRLPGVPSTRPGTPQPGGGTTIPPDHGPLRSRERAPRDPTRPNPDCPAGSPRPRQAGLSRQCQS